MANRVRREVEWLRRGPKARTSKSRSRIQAAEQSIEALAESDARQRGGSVGLDFNASGRRTKRLWSCEGLSKRFGERRPVENLDLLLTAGTRLGLLGANGSGKTTLLRMIVGELEPDAGTIRQADDLRIVYFDQSRESVDPSLSLRRALAPDGDTVLYRDRSLHVVSWASRFLFSKRQLDTPVARLSGGERARIVLARVMLRPADLLILDEPTNDLDIPTLDVLEESLLDFPGALVLVSHDRHLMERVSTAILALDGEGGTERFADCDQWLAARPDAPRKAPAKPKVTPRTSAPKKKLSYMDQREFDTMEARVLEAEQRLESARAAASDPAIASDAVALQERHDALAVCESEVSALYERWAELEAKIEG